MRYLGYSFGQICAATENPTKSNANRASDLDGGVKRGSRLKSTTLPSQHQCTVKSYLTHLTQEKEGEHESFYPSIGSDENKKSKFIRKHEEEKNKSKNDFFFMWCSGTI